MDIYFLWLYIFVMIFGILIKGLLRGENLVFGKRIELLIKLFFVNYFNGRFW